MIPRLGDGNYILRQEMNTISDIKKSLENDSPSRGRKQWVAPDGWDHESSLENDSPSRGRKQIISGKLATGEV